jgi:outer membrane protein assembly factor BamB
MRRCLTLCLFVAATFTILALNAPTQAENWPQWRGPTNDGISQEKNLPTQWSEDPKDAGKDQNIVWKLRLAGRGGSTPAIWGDRIFLTSEDGDNIVLLCISTDGKELWKHPLGTGHKRYMRDEGDLASASPSTDGQHIWAFDGLGDFVCVVMDGKEVWRFNAQERYGKFCMQWGTHTTPLLYGDRLYLQLLHSGGHWVIALDKATGKEVWKVERPTDARAECKESYTSPVVWHDGKNAYLVTHGNDYGVALRLEDGQEIWRVADLNPKEHYNPTLRFVASPLASADLIVIPSAKNGPVVGVKPNANGLVEKGSAYEQWRLAKGTPDVPSPFILDGLVYLCRETGVLVCLDAKTGKELYNERLHNARHRASPVYGDGKLYLAARDGMVTVVRAGPKFEKLASNRLHDDISASPVISNGRIYIRGFKNLYAIGSAQQGAK